MPKQIIIREDFRRDGLAAHFLVSGKLMRNVAQAFPGSRINIGYPAICEREVECCADILKNLRDLDIEPALVGHADKNHLERMGKMISPYPRATANFWIPMSDYFIKQTLYLPPKELLAHSLDLVRYWRGNFPSHQLDIALADCIRPEDGESLVSRIAEFSKNLHQAGARSIIVCDTRGACDGDFTRNVFEKIRNVDQGELEWHPHNDNGRALDVIPIVLEYDVRAVGTALFRSGERRTMLDPREVIASGINIPSNIDHLTEFEHKYHEFLGDSPDTISQELLGEGTYITGSQLRLWGRPEAKTLFGVTSDKYIFSKLTNMSIDRVSGSLLRKLKNLLYERKKLFFTGDELLSMKKEWENELQEEKERISYEPEKHRI